MTVICLCCLFQHRATETTAHGILLGKRDLRIPNILSLFGRHLPGFRPHNMNTGRLVQCPISDTSTLSGQSPQESKDVGMMGSQAYTVTLVPQSEPRQHSQISEAGDWLQETWLLLPSGALPSLKQASGCRPFAASPPLCTSTLLPNAHSKAPLWQHPLCFPRKKYHQHRHKHSAASSPLPYLPPMTLNPPQTCIPTRPQLKAFHLA